MGARIRWVVTVLALALAGGPARVTRVSGSARGTPAAAVFTQGRGAAGIGAGAPIPAPAEDAELRAFQRAFRAARDPLEVAEVRLAALAALVGDERPAVARALLEGYAGVERELERCAERHLAAVATDQRANGIEYRPELDLQRGLQDHLLEVLLGIEEPETRAWLVERVVEDGRLPLGLRLACADRATDLEPSRGLLRELERALGRARREPGEALVALRTAAALGPAAGELERPLAEALEAASPRVRAGAAAALAAVARPGALEPLIAALGRERGRGARRVAEALQVLTGARLGTREEAWRRWLEREGGPFLDGSAPLGGGTGATEPDESARYHGIPLEGRSILFVIDRSRSMTRPLARPGGAEAGPGVERAGPLRRIDRARAELVRALGALGRAGGDDPARFGLIAFAGRVAVYEDEPLPATPDRLERAFEWIEGLDLELGTNTYGALEVAFQQAGRGAADVDYEPRYDTVYLLSDGLPTIGGGERDAFEPILSAVRRWNAAGGLVVHTVGLGDEVPADLMGELARQHGGRFVLETAAGAVDLSGRPNVVLFLVDDLGWRDVGFAGGDFDTPAVDRLAAGGTRFESAYACGPNCAPSRAGLLTGLASPRHGIYSVPGVARGPESERALVPVESAAALRPELPTLASVLAGAGYATAAIGKWHLGEDPTAHGFQLDVGGTAAGHPASYFSPYHNAALPDGPEGEYLTERLTDEALGFVRAHAEEPFFLYLSHYGVHAPFEAPEPLRAKYAARLGDGPRATYAAMVESVDTSLGRVLDLLAELGLEERTLVCFTSDNGALAQVTSLAPLRGQKGTLYEGGLRVPLVIRWPGRVAEGGVAGAPVIGLDLLPTVAQLCGVACPPVDGESLVPLLLGAEGGGRGAGRLGRDALFWHFPDYLKAYDGEHSFRARPCGVVRRGRHKLIEGFEDGHLELYDLRVDPGETRNLADEEPGLRDELLELLREWRAATGAPVPTERDPVRRR